jgi:hypothetical protein
LPSLQFAVFSDNRVSAAATLKTKN